MAFYDDKYIRKILDAREKWGVLLSLTAIAGLLHLLSDKKFLAWVNVMPFLIGVGGSFFVLVVNCYYKQAETIADAKTMEDKEKEKKKKWYKYVLRISILGRLHILAPIVIGTFATLILLFGILSAPAANRAESIQSTLIGDKTMNFTEKLQIWTLVLTALRTLATVIAAVGVVFVVKTFRFNTWLKAQAIYVDKEFYDARKTVLSRFGFKESNPPTFVGQDKDHALLVCRKMDELAHLTPYIKKEKIIEVWGIPMGKSWLILKDIVGQERKTDDRKWFAFEKLAEEAIEKYDLREKNETLAK